MPTDRRSIAKGFALCLTMFAANKGKAFAAAAGSVATYKGADRQSVLEAAAKKEGHILVFTVGSQIDPILTAFTKKYPYIQVKTLKDEGPKVVQRVTQEYAAGLYEVDAFELDDYGLSPLLAGGFLAPFWSPEMVAYPPEALEQNGRWAMMRQDFAGLGVNTAAYALDAAPKKNADLLDPKWKGRLAVAGRPSSLSLWVGALVLSEGADFVRKLGKQDVRLYNMGGAAVDGLVATGEAPLVLDSRRSHIYTSRQAGAPVAWRALGPCYTAVSGVALAAKAPHPAASMLLLDFILSKDAQAIYTDKLGYVSLRKDMPASDAPTQKLYLDTRPTFESDYSDWSDLASAAFNGGL